MELRSVRPFLAVAIFLLVAPEGIPAQNFRIGLLSSPTGTFGSSPRTAVDLQFIGPGIATAATFRWSSAACPKGVKIKIGVLGIEHSPFHFPELSLVDERGPFDVLSTTQTVALVPPLRVTQGTRMGISGITSCGEPVSGQPTPAGTAAFANEWVGNQVFVTVTTYLSVQLLLSDDSVSLLNNRFLISLQARDPRSGRTATGRGITHGDRFGYFSLPDFTGDPDFPEVIVKMADATASAPPFGGAFWFFYSALTDVEYTLTVLDQVKQVTRVYTNLPSAPGQLCGGADTDAFRP